MTVQFNDVLLELDKMENFAEKEYIDAISILSDFIRNTIWNESNTYLIYAILINMNKKISELNSMKCIANFDLLNLYVKSFKAIWTIFSPYFPDNIKWNKLEKKFDSALSYIIIKKQWDILNPYIDSTKKDENFGGDLLSIFDSMFKYAIHPNESHFILNYTSIKFLYRAARGKHDYIWLLPTPKYSGLNRWNPPSRCFAYTSIEDKEEIYDKKNDILHGEMICLEELRAQKNEIFTLCKMELSSKDNNKKVFDFSYNTIDYGDLDMALLNARKAETNEIIDRVIALKKSLQIKDKSKLVNIINYEVNRRYNRTLSFVSIYSAQTLLKMICDKVFVPLDKDEDNDDKKREKCYGAFHALATYLEKKGYSGIIYPSTRTSLINQKGRNLVLFNYKDIKCKPDTLKVIRYNGYS